MKLDGLEEGRRDAVVEAMAVVVVVYSDGVYLDESIRRSGMGSTEDVVGLIILCNQIVLGFEIM